jgi:hypothetical protein
MNTVCNPDVSLEFRRAGTATSDGDFPVKEYRDMLTGAKVFTATKAKDREELGEVLTRWIRDNPRAKILDKIVTQSSDSEFHCLSITVFYEMPAQ